MGRLRKFADLAVDDQIMLLGAVWDLLAAKVMHVLAPSHLLVRWLRRAEISGENCQRPARNSHDLALVSWAISTVARALPWECNCLVQAIATKRNLSRMGLQGSAVFGVAKALDGKVVAHVWIVNDSIQVSGKTQQEFQPLLPGGAVTLPR